MQALKIFVLTFTISFSLSLSAADKKSPKQTLRQPVNLAVSFETLGKNKALLHTLSFDGEQKTLLSAAVNNATDFKCESSGQFELVSVGVKQFVAAFIEFECGENDQKIKSKIGRLLIPVKDYQSFFKIIFLHKDQPEVVLKIKELSL